MVGGLSSFHDQELAEDNEMSSGTWEFIALSDPLVELTRIERRSFRKSPATARKPAPMVNCMYSVRP